MARPFPVLLTFDLDAESGALAADAGNAARPGVLSVGQYGAKVGVYRILRLLERHHLPATFFIPGWVVDHYPDAVAAIHAAGHEIAHHGYTHEAPAGQSKEEERRALLMGIASIERATGQRPLGYRSPSWDFSPQTLDLLQEHGFLYSSNFMDSDGPYRHPGDIVELPVQWLLDDAPFFLFRAPFSRPIQPLSVAYETWSEEFQALYDEHQDPAPPRPGQAPDTGKCFVLTLHPQLIGRPSRVAMLDRLLFHMQDFPGARFLRCADLARAWLKGEQGPVS